MSIFSANTRTRIGARHALIAPDSHVPSVIPGMKNATPIVLISNELGAEFSQLLVRFEANGQARFTREGVQDFVYVVKGQCEVELSSSDKAQLEAGGFVYAPAGIGLRLRAGEETEINVFQKQYVPLEGVEAPSVRIGRKQDIEPIDFMDDPALKLHVLLPEEEAFDMAVNVFDYAIGATLPFVETHIMEHGLLMLKGEGIYRLEEDWYPVREGDAIWMDHYCPQWFVAMGKQPASYLYYKDVNRQPLR